MTERIATPIRTRAIMERYGFNFKKGFGQNFLIDTNVLDNIADAAGITSEDTVLEIGPGFGSLTQTVAERAKKVISLEIDTKLIPILNETLADYNNIEIINKDVLKCDIDELSREKNDGKPFKVVANLPYYITTPIIMDMLEKHSAVTSMTVMVQKEVAERMQAGPKSSDYGALSVAVQFYADTNIDMIVQPSCFMPRPKVASAVITLKLRDKPSVDVKDKKLFFHIVKCAFGQRRKTLLNTLCNQGNFNMTKEEIGEVIRSAGLDERIRGEAMSLQEFGILSDKFYNIINK
ncbi:16S rRNA (adenine(1518)-N(6)/adenine(1519)-N(6))-dimethyltransferase RsmA [Anaerotignum sp. MSJ-24]|uniref:16S rRNA (adenine(1518)-N(6)/adenine(1519)-N(6))- dimethyltransferase RsmA n=1 Tax=Anaerotignum sp. MSJ-24 TaxID=2841521 RepID=UPI001C11D1DB|nr:16S rRNA (adenine(1518)-N(6)/adenine(1519)-N(6))-dimethyltransferase RsmA [Anaerotignum sp. MSJ-24]MBU5463316.1 16S rRNA (adenine(1518)-N(6)/adenine(1519)-N(6))-dimethyltransferase RsmA [Anaerotignum sp. MSJ-24]